MQLQAFLNTVENDNLLENTRITGKFLLNGLHNLSKKYPELISNVRGVGTYIAMDFPSPFQRDDAIVALRQNGVESSGSRDVSIRFRPALIFQPRHAAEFLDIFDKVCGQI